MHYVTFPLLLVSSSACLFIFNCKKSVNMGTGGLNYFFEKVSHIFNCTFKSYALL